MSARESPYSDHQPLIARSRRVCVTKASGQRNRNESLASKQRHTTPPRAPRTERSVQRGYIRRPEFVDRATVTARLRFSPLRCPTPLHSPVVHCWRSSPASDRDPPPVSSLHYFPANSLDVYLDRVYRRNFRSFTHSGRKSGTYG